MSYSDSNLRYRIDGDLKDRDPENAPAELSEDWPYRNFMPLLPCVPFRLSDMPALMDLRGSRNALRAWPEQQPAQLEVAVSPPATVGLSLRGDGNGGGVSIGVDYNLEGRIPGASNVT